MSSFNKTIELLIFDGDPNGRIMCELSNWNGRVYKISRTSINDFSIRADAENTGVYFLFGKNDTNKDTVYIGEAERILTRLRQHLNDEEYWNDCIVVTSKDDVLNKAHVKFLEHQFYCMAQEAGRFIVTNRSIPTCSSISEYDEAMLEEFIDNAKLLVNTLGYKTFDTIQEETSNSSKTLFYISAARGAEGQGIIVPDGFAVLAGSKIATSTVPSMPLSFKALREQLLTSGVIDNNFTFTRDYVFTSPTLAAATVMGRSANGRTEWKTSDHKTLKEVEEAKTI